MLEKQSDNLLEECRQIMTKRMRSSLTGMLNEVDERLMDMAQDQSAGLKEADCYEAVREIRLKRVEIKTRFERRFINLFESALKQQELGEKTIPTGYQNVLKKHGRSQESKPLDVPLERSLGEVNKKCGEVLMELDRKMSQLIDSGKAVNPVQPAFVFEAFNEACWDIKSGDEVRHMMFKVFEQRMSRELESIYDDINSLLKKQTDPNRKKQEQVKLDVVPGKQEQETVMLRYEVINRIEARLTGHVVPDFVRYFLIKHWRSFLEGIYSEYSENSIAWNAARQTMDDLIWIVSRPENQYDRERQVQLLPSLLFRLLNGMKVINMQEHEIENFLGDLKTHQLQNLDSTNSSLLDSITEEAKESIRNNYSKLPH